MFIDYKILAGNIGAHYRDGHIFLSPFKRLGTEFLAEAIIHELAHGIEESIEESLYSYYNMNPQSFLTNFGLTEL
ncbi:MAG: aminopeptidase [Candidatus Omnitrophica bacterium]|nr:aminopeptidase [Candidatus Omnitrophota bacterium]